MPLKNFFFIEAINMNLIFRHLGLYPLTKYKENLFMISRVKSFWGFWTIIWLFGNTKLFLKKTLSFSCNYRKPWSRKNFKKSLELTKSYKDKAFFKTNWHKELFCKKYKLIFHLFYCRIQKPLFLHLGLYPLTKYEENPLRISRVQSLWGFWAIICVFGNTKLYEELQGESIFQNNLAQRIVLQKVQTYFPFPSDYFIASVSK